MEHDHEQNQHQCMCLLFPNIHKLVWQSWHPCKLKKTALLLDAHKDTQSLTPSPLTHSTNWLQVGLVEHVNSLSVLSGSCSILQDTYQIVREATPAPLFGAESLTPVTQGTGWLQVALVEHVNQVACGQGFDIQPVHISLHESALSLQRVRIVQ